MGTNSPNDTRKTSAARRSPRTRKKRILLAEDDREMRALISQVLRHDGYVVTECVDGRKLLSRLGSSLLDDDHHQYDLIISDVNMPGPTGLAVLRGLRDSHTLPPMILITAFGDPAMHQAASSLGAVALLDKPFELDDLTRTAHQTLAPC